MELVEILTRLGGVASTAELVAVSSRRKVRSALGRGEVVRVGRDRLALPAREHGVRAARALNGYLSHASAALHHGWEIWSQPDLPRVMLPRGRTVPHELPELAEIGVRHLPSSDRDGWATSYLRTVLDCARDLPFVEALAVADSALRSGDLMVDNLEAAAARLTRGGRACASSPVARRPSCGQPVRVSAAGAGDPVRPGRHSPVRDRCGVAGWLVLRFTWDQVRHNPDSVRRTIRSLLETREQPHASPTPADDGPSVPA